MDELLQDAGARMLSYGQRADVDDVRTLSLNGAELHLLSGRSPDAPDALLDVWEARCGQVGGQFSQQLRGALPKAARHTRDPRALLDGVLRSDDGERGYVACFDLGGARVPATDLVARLRAFAASGDLAAIGDLRFAFVQRAGGTTSYVALWSAGRLPLRAMFPAHGDAPGVDLAGVPRPSGARRVLSAYQTQREPLLVSYASTEAPAQVAAAYRAQLLAQGFELRDDPGDAAHGWLLRRGPLLAIAVIAAAPHGGTSLSLSRLH